jgi:uncharacterized protein (DUF2141 family)
MRVTLSTDDLGIIEEALGFYRMANIDVANPLTDDQYPQSADVARVESKIRKALDQ